jgi:hypothetical protein
VVKARLLSRSLLAAVGALSVNACVTAEKHVEPLPAVLAPYFGGCSPADGAASLRIYEGDDLIGSGDLAWTAAKGGEWEAEVVSPLGQTLLHVKRRGDQLGVAGSLAARLPSVAVRDDQFLEVDGHFIGIKAAEIPCLLGFHVPRPWLDGVVALDNDGARTEAELSEPQRSMTVTATGIRQGAVERICSRVSWPVLLGLRTGALDWCQDFGGAQPGGVGATGQLTGFEAYSLRWTRIDEP